MPRLEAGEYYGGTFKSVAVVEIGEKKTRAMAIAIEIDGEEHETTMWLGGSYGRDGITNDERIQARLVELGCNMDRLLASGAMEHIHDTLAGKTIRAKAELYNGAVYLKGFYKSGGGARRVEIGGASPFGKLPPPAEEFAANDDDAPF
jgi:hypothetical protein